ncbi:MAG: hypothetical protein ACI4F7_10340 [Acutalibacteraceae bacterium]
MSNRKKAVLLSAMSLAVAVLLLGYSAYGWFSMSRSVRAVGQNVTVTVPDNLMISLSESGPWSESVTVELNDIVKKLTETDPEKFTEGRFYLLPASTYAGFNDTVWQTGKAKHNGAPADDAVFYKGRRIMWNQSTSAFEGHWIDVPLYFMTDSEASVNVALLESTTSITPVGTEDIAITKTVRAAFLNEDCTKSSMGDTAPLVFAGNNSTGVFGGEIIETATTKKPPVYLTFDENGISVKQLFTVAANGAVKQIVVRIWIEGQDENCIAKIGGQTFSLSLGFCAIN